MRIHKITRRNFMKVAGVSALAMGLAACGGSSSSTAASTSTAYLLPLLQAARSPVIRS